MPEVAIKIGPKTYNIACGEGEQDKIAALGAIVAEKYAQLGAARAPLEAQNMLFASLFMADELNEGRKQCSHAEQEREEALAQAAAAEETVEAARHETKTRLEDEHAAAIQALEQDHEQERNAASAALREAKAEIAQLQEAAKEAGKGIEAQRASLETEAQAKIAETRAELERERTTCDALKTDLRAENETLRRAEERARTEAERLAGELADLREAQAVSDDLFSTAAAADHSAHEAATAAIAETLEKLAARAEEAAKALEGTLEPSVEGALAASGKSA
ncbi:MAG: hypothetical protein AAF127_00800 [Pseudomonadota bacterium]